MTTFPRHQVPGQEPSDSNEVSIVQLLWVLMNHKWLILSVALIFMLGGYFYASSQPRVYQADSLVQLENRGAMFGMGMGMGMMEPPAGGGPIGNPASADLEILQSRMVMGETVDRLDLTIEIEPRHLPGVGSFLVHHGMTYDGFSRLTLDLFNGLPTWLMSEESQPVGSPFVWSGETLEVSRFDVPEAHEDEWHALVVTGAETFELRREEQPILLGRVGETLQNEEQGYRLFVSRLEAHTGAEFQVRRVSRLKAINQLQGRLSIMPRGIDSGVFQLTLSGTDPERIDQTLDTLTGAFLTQNVQRHSEEAEKQIAFLDEQLPKVNQHLTESENRLNDYRSQRDSVDLTFETENLLTRLVAVENQLNELALAEAELAERFRPTHPNYQSLLRQRSQLQAEHSRLEEQINGLPETQQEVLRLTRDTQVSQQVYVQLLNKRQEMRLVKAGTVGNVRILDSAVLQQATIAPRIPLVTLVSAALGAMFAVAGVLLKLVLSRAVESADQLEALGLPVYATVPVSESQSRLTTRIRARHNRKGQEVFRGLLAEQKPDEIAVESLRALRTSLYFAMLESGNNRLLIAGASPGVGKSFVAANLAAVCAQAGQRVLLVDTDMRRGHLHHIFHEHGSPGLSELLACRAELTDTIRKTSLSGLDYVARGIVPPNPSELLMQRTFHEFLDEVGTRYDLVILDTPPVLAVTDAAVVGKLAGTCLLVVRFGRNPLKEVRVTKRRLENAGIRLKGTILNGIEMTANARKGYYGTYLYAYR